jgi:aspartyl/asparaginyl beta-hydroxylase (cupin superfamily)
VIRIGCSGWNYQHWRGPVYPSSEPSRRWLDLYADWFDTVEVNATFYPGTPDPLARDGRLVVHPVSQRPRAGRRVRPSRARDVGTADRRRER